MALERRWKVLCAYCGSNAVQETMENGSGANAEASPVGVLDDIWSLPSTRLQVSLAMDPCYEDNQIYRSRILDHGITDFSHLF